MRHARHKYKLGVDPAHRQSMMKNLAISIIEHGKIKTTQTRAKALKSFVEKLVTISKTDSVHNRRLAFQRLNSKKAVSKLFADYGPKFQERNGGYTRVTKLPDGRVGDGTKMSYISFLE